MRNCQSPAVAWRSRSKSCPARTRMTWTAANSISRQAIRPPTRSCQSLQEGRDMAFSLTWLAEVLEDAGLKVAEQPGWRSRGRGEMGTVKGVMCHHTAGSAKGVMPSLDVITNGRPDLAGSLAQLGLAATARTSLLLQAAAI